MAVAPSTLIPAAAFINPDVSRVPWIATVPALKSPPISGVVVLELAITNLSSSASWSLLYPALCPKNTYPVHVVTEAPA